MVRRLVLFVALLSVLVGLPLAIIRAGDCSLQGFSGNPAAGTIQTRTAVTFSGSVSCSPGMGKLQILAGSSEIAVTQANDIGATWTPQYPGHYTIVLRAYASDNPIVPHNWNLDYDVTEGGQQPQQNNPQPPSNGGGGNTQSTNQNSSDNYIGTSSPPNGNWVQAQTEPLLVYRDMSTSSQVIAQIHSGMYVSESAHSNGWTQVFTNNGVGWVIDGNGYSVRKIASDAIPNPNVGGTTDGGTSPAATVPQKPCVGFQNQPMGGWLLVTASPSLNIHSDANMNAKVLAAACSGRYLGVIATSPGWIQVNWESGYGWVVDDAAFSQRNVVSPVIQQPTLIPQDNGSQAPVVVPTQAPPNAPCVGFQNPPMGNWVHVIANPSLNIHVNADQNSTIIAAACNGRYLGVIGTMNGFTQVNWESGYGWVVGSADYVEQKDTTTQSQPSQGFAPATHPEARTQDGGLELNVTCRNWGYDTEQHSDAGVDIGLSHRCVKDQQVLYLKKAELDRACKEAWGGEYFAELQNADMLGGIKCVTNPNAVFDYGDGRDPHAATAVPPTQVPPSTYSAGPVITSSKPNEDGSAPMVTTCTASMYARLQNGGKGRVVINDIGVYAFPTINSAMVLSIKIGTVFGVRSDANCQSGVNWFQIDVDGVTGWAPEGSGGVFYVEPVINPQFPAANGDIVTIHFPDSTQFNLIYDRVNYRILNGAQLVAWEINRLRNRMNREFDCTVGTVDCFNYQATKPFFDAFIYNAELVGEVETLRNSIEASLCNGIKTCVSAIRMVVGDKLMDTSGPGNVVFGYICEQMGISKDQVEDPFSAFTQTVGSALREGKYQKDDYPDDKEQRKMGRIVKLLSGDSTVLATSIETASRQVGDINH